MELTNEQMELLTKKLHFEKVTDDLTKQFNAIREAHGVGLWDMTPKHVSELPVWVSLTNEFDNAFEELRKVNNLIYKNGWGMVIREAIRNNGGVTSEMLHN